MERLMLLRLETVGCLAEVAVNGVPLLRVGAAGAAAAASQPDAPPPAPHVACVPVHEYTLAGANRLLLTVAPPPLPAIGGAAAAATLPQPVVADGRAAVRLRLVLVRQGQSPLDPQARVLAQHDWAPAAGERYEAPFTQPIDVELPVNFPRWRWLDAPPVVLDASLARRALSFAQNLALDLGRGQTEAFMAAARLRFEELGVAYQRAPAEGAARFREHIERLYADKALHVVPPQADNWILRPVADGRLLECLGADGQPALRSIPPAADQPTALWPLRLAVVEGQFYVLR